MQRMSFRNSGKSTDISPSSEQSATNWLNLDFKLFKNHRANQNLCQSINLQFANSIWKSLPLDLLGQEARAERPLQKYQDLARRQAIVHPHICFLNFSNDQ